ncbi:ankyrin repeat domain-containing protein [Legionella gresilensis]|uniref:ankyrin repeat domain-containing protein n=1 Tax=Legionella gresilensis TaxID=91823 RepID=UPI0010410DB7|nr:ankyrin repeat domain-containing protein [Legionella gresilensis]
MLHQKNRREVYINAVEKQDVGGVEQLLGNGVGVNIRIDKDLNTGLHSAIKKRNANLSKIFALYKADYNLKDKNGQSPIDIAVEMQAWDCIQAMGEFYTIKEEAEQFNTAVSNAIEQYEDKNKKAKKIKVDNPQETTVFSNNNSQITPIKKGGQRQQFIDAVLQSKISEIEACLAQGVSPNIRIDKNFNTALHYAFQNKDLALITLLVINRINHGLRNKDKKTAIELAIEMGWWAGIESFVKAGSFKDDAYLGTALLAAIQERQDSMIPILLNAGASVNTVNAYGDNSMHLAVTRNQPELIQLLLQYNPDLMKENSQGNTPFAQAIIENKHLCASSLLSNEKRQYNDILFQAVNKNHTLFALGLLRAGAVPSHPQILFKPIENKNYDLVKVLLACGARLDSLNELDKSPIEVAALQGDWEMVRLIASTHATDITDSANYDAAFMLALKANRIDIVQLLIKAGAPLYCFYLEEGEKYLIALAENRYENEEVINIILLAAAKANSELRKIIVSHLGRLPEFISELFEDPILAEELKVPMITPQGTTYSKNSIINLDKDPINRAALNLNLLRHNQLVEDLIAFYKDVNVLKDTIPPLLICPQTKNFYQEPVVAIDGKTYEKSLVIAYLQQHGNQLPSGELQNSEQLYPNRLIVQLIREKYLPQFFIKSIKERNISLLTAVLQYDATLIQTPIDELRNTAFHYILDSNEFDKTLFDYLVKLNANFFAENLKGISPLHLAIEKKGWEIIERFIELNKGNEEEYNYFFQILYQAAKLHQTDLIKILLQNKTYNELVNKESIVEKAAKLNIWECVIAIVEQYSTDTFDTWHYDNVLLDAVKQNKLNVVKALLNAGSPMLCFSSIEGTTCLEIIMQNKEQNSDMISLLLQAGKNRTPSVSFHLQSILAKSQNLSDRLPEEISEFFEDTINFEDIAEPYITPQGKTYSKETITQCQNDPETNESLKGKLIPNVLVADLLYYYRLPHVDINIFPSCLICPETNKPYQNPVVAVNGRTYEETYLKAYLMQYSNHLPDGTLQDRDPYINRSVKMLLETKYAKKAEIFIGDSSFTFFNNRDNSLLSENSRLGPNGFLRTPQ